VTLPSDEQWRQAYVGDTGRDFPWGQDYLPGQANLDETWGGKEGFYLGRTSTVGLYLKGVAVSGALDMAGNIWEWCLRKDSDRNDTAIGGEDPRVVRGGSWVNDPDNARGVFRYGLNPRNRNYDRGFRVLCVSPIEG
jgi:formylglycine-generating enzyme required for sulfatase activity